MRISLSWSLKETPAELRRFAAEWDQPFELTTDNPDAAWLYAVSQRLRTTREQDKLTFHLSGYHDTIPMWKTDRLTEGDRGVTAVEP